MKAIMHAGPRIAAARTVTVYVVNQTSNTVTPISAAANKPGRPIPLPPGTYATSIWITPSCKTAYVNNSAGPEVGYVTPINTATNKALRPFFVLGSPHADPVLRTVTPVNLAANTALPPIWLTSPPQAIAITPNGKTAYAANYLTVTPINTAISRPRKPNGGRGLRYGHDPERGDPLRIRLLRERRDSHLPGCPQGGPGDQGLARALCDRDNPERQDRLRGPLQRRSRSDLVKVHLPSGYRFTAKYKKGTSCAHLGRALTHGEYFLTGGIA